MKVHEVAEIRLRVRKPIAFDVGGKVPALGRFVLMRGRRIGGGGVIDSVVEEPTDIRGAASLVSRSAILGHRGCIIWMTGLSGSGKSTLAQALEQRLLRSGVLAAVLDGDVLRTGLSQNLGFTAEDRSENLRRATELAIHLADAGDRRHRGPHLPLPRPTARWRPSGRRSATSPSPRSSSTPRSPSASAATRSSSTRRRARAQITQFTGIDSPYEPPLAPDLELRTDRETVELVDREAGAAGPGPRAPHRRGRRAARDI